VKPTREPKLEFKKGRVSKPLRKLVDWKVSADVAPDQTAMLYLDERVVELTADKPLVFSIERRLQGGSERYAIHIDVKD
jgi:hypothetical protein